VVHEEREDEANMMVRFVWLEVARRRQRRAAELSGGGGKNRERKLTHGELDVYIGIATVSSSGRRASSRWRSWSRGKAVEAVRRLAGAHAVRWPTAIGDATVALPPNFSNSNCFPKLLSNSCNNLKNAQDMKSSEFQALQVLY
jgi:hypothetical protein